jgi:hypothetical protein
MPTLDTGSETRIKESRIIEERQNLAIELQDLTGICYHYNAFILLY